LPAAVYTTDAGGRITYYNKAAAEMAGRKPQLGVDQWCVTWRLYDADGNPLPHEECPMAVALKENRSVRNVEALAERPDGTLVPFLPYPTPLRDSDGALVGAVNMLIDISERKQAEAHQMMLLKELNHRVKNNMQMLQSMLSASQREASDTTAKALLADATRRVAAMAAAQKVLYDQGGPTGFKVREFLGSVCGVAQNAFDKEVQISVAAGDEILPNDFAMPVALILNELLTNAVKHGINGSSRGTISVALIRAASGYELTVEDDGPGFELAATGRKRSSGLGLVAGLARRSAAGSTCNAAVVRAALCISAKRRPRFSENENVAAFRCRRPAWRSTRLATTCVCGGYGRLAIRTYAERKDIDCRGRSSGSDRGGIGVAQCRLPGRRHCGDERPGSFARPRRKARHRRNGYPLGGKARWHRYSPPAFHGKRSQICVRFRA